MDNYLINSIAVVSFLGFSYYYGYFSAVSNWIKTSCQRVKILITLMDKIKTDISMKKDSMTSFTVNDTDTSATIMYQRLDETYLVLVPYNRKYVAPMSQFKVELLRNNNKSIEITQQPGIPYLVNAENLGGYAIRVTNQETGKFHDYLNDKAPVYCEEVMDFE